MATFTIVKNTDLKDKADKGLSKDRGMHGKPQQLPYLIKECSLHGKGVRLQCKDAPGLLRIIFHKTPYEL